MVLILIAFVIIKFSVNVIIIILVGVTTYISHLYCEYLWVFMQFNKAWNRIDPFYLCKFSTIYAYLRIISCKYQVIKG